MSEDSIFGIISLIFWSVTIIVTVTYVLLVMRADNDGEGGIMALIALIRRRAAPGGRRAKLMLAALGVFGASLFFGDSLITPAISVLSAIEGVKVAAPSVTSLVVPITVVIIVGPVPAPAAGHGRGRAPVRPGDGHLVRRHRRDRRARHRRPSRILNALSPTYALSFLVGHFPIAFFSLAAVVLAVTGAEALYADMGHFGRSPITRVWLILVFPACILSYLGQAALVLSHPGSIRSPFFLLVPGLGAAPDGLPGRRGDGHRLAGGHHRRVLGRAAGRPAWLPSAAAHRVHLGEADRPDLRAVDQLGAAGRGPRARAHLQELE